MTEKKTIKQMEIEIDALKDRVEYYRQREDRLWQTLMAVAAVLHGVRTPPIPEITESYYISFIKDAEKVVAKTKPWWRLWK